MNKDEALERKAENARELGLDYEPLEAKDEPVAFKIYKPTYPREAIPNVRDAELPWVYDQDPSSGNVASMWVTPVQATPPKQAEKQEPVGKFAKFTDGIWREVTDGSAGVPLYTTPSQRKPLTDEEIEDFAANTFCVYSFARAIEVAHGITGENK